MRLTPSQQAAIDHRGSNLLVSASAGSGKTEVLARRCVSLIADPQQPCGVERLLVVTFTRAAAAELRVRIARELRKEADQTRDEPLRDHLRRQEVLVDAADIGTIDAWCGRIVRDHSAEAGVDGEFTTLGEEDARLLRREVLDELFEWVYSSGDGTAVAARDWLGRHSRADDGFLRGLVGRLNQFRENLVEVERWFGQQRKWHAQDDDALWAESCRELSVALARECGFQREQLEMLTVAAGPDLAGCLQPLHDAVTDWAERLARGGADETGPDGLLTVVAEVDAFRLSKARGLPEKDQPVFDEVAKRWLKLRLKDRWSRAAVENILNTAPESARLARTLLTLEQCYQDRLTAAKRARAACEFGDVLRLALDLLGTPSDAGPRQPTGIARRLRQRYEHILVDEYQDTSPVQVELLRLVTRDELGRSNRFMVGDVKQSIYGFRQAEPRLFSELVEAFGAGRQEGTVRYLSDNFRSHPDLVTGLNQVFTVLFDPALGGTAFGEDERLRAGRDEITNPTLDGQPRIELHLFQPPQDEQPRPEIDEEALPLERLERETLTAARMIHDMRRDGVQVPQRDERGATSLRSLRLSDVVILLRSAKHNAATVAGVLRAAGIPCLTSGREGLFDVPEVMDLRNVLALLVNRRQDVALAAYLRSPLVGLSAAELLRMRAASPHGDFWDAVVRFCQWSETDEADAPLSPTGPPHGEDDELVANVRSALEQLACWRVVARERELPELLGQIFHDTGLLLFAAGLPGGEHRVALLRAVERFAADFVRQGQQGVAEFVAYLEDLATAELSPGVPVPAGEDAVRIMTIHAAKGLEFPIVFLLNAASPHNLRRGSELLQCDEEHGLGLRFWDYPARSELVSARHEIIRHRAVARDVEEELRLLYVATTRARERLLICGHAPAGAWERACAQHANRPGPPPLVSRLSAGNMLEWVLMAAAASGSCETGDGAAPAVAVVMHDKSQAGGRSSGEQTPALPTPSPEWDGDDEAWVGKGQALLEAAFDRSLAALPAVMSVSALKEAARPDRSEDVPRVLDAGAVSLRVPAFAAGAEPEGRDVGTACHRFLEHADLKRMLTEPDIRAQIEELLATGCLSAADAELIPAADIAWFANTATGRQLAARASAVRRELAFVYACPIGCSGEATIVRGVIDCLLDTDAGLVILDYKTDRVSDAAALEQRVESYTVQMQLYAQAAGRIFARPVAQVTLVFLHARRLVQVSREPPSMIAGTILGR